MALIPYRPPFKDLEDWFEDWDFPRFPITPVIKEPRMDIYEEGNNVVAEIETSGIDPTKLEVSIKNNILRVEGKEEEKKEEKKRGYYQKEIRRGYFKRIASLPVEVLGDKAEAVCEDGILKVMIPKARPAAEKPEKKIEVKVKKTKK